MMLSFLEKEKDLLFLSCLHVSVHHARVAPTEDRGGVELELQVLVSHRVDARNQTQVSARAARDPVTQASLQPFGLVVWLVG